MKPTKVVRKLRSDTASKAGRARKTKALKVMIPARSVAAVIKEFAALGLPASVARAELRDQAITSCAEYCIEELVFNHTFPNRGEAVRTAEKIFALHNYREAELGFIHKGKFKYEKFANPAHAKKEGSK